MANSKYKQRAFTIVELMMALIITSVMMVLIISVFRFSIFSFNKSEQELTYQGDIRYSMDEMKDSVEKTRAIFLMNNNDFYSATNEPKYLKEKWDYYALSADKKQFLLYRYNPSKTPVTGEPAYLAKHEVIVLTDLADRKLDLSFEKQVVLTEDEKKGKGKDELGNKMTKDEAEQKQLTNAQNHFVKINLQTLDGSDDLLRDLETGIEAKAAITVTNAKDLSNLSSNPINVMAVRSTGFGSERIVFISIILDASGSMRCNIDGSIFPNDYAEYAARSHVARFDMLKDTLNGRADGIDKAGNPVKAKTGFFESMSGYGAFYVRLVPYGDTANYPQINYYKGVDEEKHPMFNLGSRSELDLAKEEIENIDKFTHRWGSFTNTGDGIRRAFYYHKSFKDDIKPQYKSIYMAKKGVSSLTPAMEAEFEKLFDGVEIKEYSIVLTDGNTNALSTKEIANAGFSNNAADLQTIYSKFLEEDGPVKSLDGKARNEGVNYETSDPAPYFYYGDKGPFAFAKDIPYSKTKNSISEEYAARMGAKIKNRGVDTYVIGFSNVKNERSSAIKLAKSMNAELFEYNNNFNLDDIFDEIANRIDADIAILKGPY